MAEIAAIVLAAGRATRFSGGADGVTKVTEIVAGEPMVRRAVDAAARAGAHPVVVVTGHARAAVRAALDGIDILEAHNPRYAEGLASSLIAGVAALPPTSAAALVLLADMPRVTADLARTLIDTFVREPGLDAVAPLVDGRRGNPVLLSRTMFARVAQLGGDEGARKLLLAPGLAVREIAAPDDAAAFDIDTPEALAALRASRSEMP